MRTRPYQLRELFLKIIHQPLMHFNNKITNYQKIRNRYNIYLSYKHQNHPKYKGNNPEEDIFKYTGRLPHVNGFSTHSYTFAIYLANSIRKVNLDQSTLDWIIAFFYASYVHNSIYHSFPEVDAAFLRAREDTLRKELTKAIDYETACQPFNNHTEYQAFNYKTAYQALEDEIKKYPNSNLHKEAQNVLHAIAHEMRPPPSFLQGLPFFKINKEKECFFKECLIRIKEILLNPSNEKIQLFNNLIKKGEGSICKQVLGAMLAFAGIALVVVNLTVTAATFGMAAPLTIAATALSGAAILAGIGLFKDGKTKDYFHAIHSLNRSVLSQ